MAWPPSTDTPHANVSDEPRLLVVVAVAVVTFVDIVVVVVVVGIDGG